MVIFYVGSFLISLCFYIRHNLYCEPYVYSLFSFFEYLAYGKLLTEPLITSNLPNNNMVHVFKCLFFINMVISYPLMLNVANDIIE